MNARHETRPNLAHLYDFCAFGVCTPSRCTQTRDTGCGHRQGIGTDLSVILGQVSHRKYH